MKITRQLAQLMAIVLVLIASTERSHAYDWIRHNVCSGEKRIKIYASFVDLRPRCGTLSGAPLAWADEGFADLRELRSTVVDDQRYMHDCVRWSE